MTATTKVECAGARTETAVRRSQRRRPDVALLTGGGDRPSALGLASSLIAAGMTFDFIGSDTHESPELRGSPRVQFLNLRGEAAKAGLLRKVTRVTRYYWRLLK